MDAAPVETGTVSSCLVSSWLLEPGTLTLALWVVQGQAVRHTFLLFLFVELLSFVWDFENIKPRKQCLGSCSWDPGTFYLGAVLLTSFGAWEIPLLRRLGGRQSSPPSDEVPLPSSVTVSLLIWDRSAAPIQKHRDYEELHLALGTVGTGWRSWADSRLAGGRVVVPRAAPCRTALHGFCVAVPPWTSHADLCFLQLQLWVDVPRCTGPGQCICLFTALGTEPRVFCVPSEHSVPWAVAPNPGQCF